MSSVRRAAVRRRPSHYSRLRQRPRQRSVERLELRHMLAGDVNPFHNAYFPQDVNNDMLVTPLDAALVISALNNSGPRNLLNAPGAGDAQGEGGASFLYDVNGDGMLTPLDALLIINHLNAQGESPIAVKYRVRLFDEFGIEITDGRRSIDPVTGQYTYTLSKDDRVGVSLQIKDNRPQGEPTTPGVALGVFASFVDLTFDPDHFTLGFSEQQSVSLTPATSDNTWAIRITIPGVGPNGEDLVTGDIFLRTPGSRAGTGIDALQERGINAFNIDQALEAAAQDLFGIFDDTNVFAVSFNNDNYRVKFLGHFVNREVPLMQIESRPTAPPGTPPSSAGLYGPANISTVTRTPHTAWNYADKAAMEFALNFNPLYATVGDLTEGSTTIRYFDVYNEAAGAIVRTGGIASGDTNISDSDGVTSYMPQFFPPDGFMEFFRPVFVAAEASDGFMIGVNPPGIPNDPQFDARSALLLIGNETGVNPQVPREQIDYGLPVIIVIAADVTADNDFVTVAENSGPTNITAQLLDGDTNNVDPGGPLFITGVGPTGTASSFSTANGTVTFENGVVTFTPSLNFNGTFIFEYGLTNDPQGTQAKDRGTVTVTVTPINDPPVAENGSGTMFEDGSATPGGPVVPFTIDLRTLASDTETPDHLLTFSVHNAVNGTVQLIDGHIARFTPTANFNGVASFGYTVTDAGDGQPGNFADPESASATVTITVTPVNDPPVANPGSFQMFEDGSEDPLVAGQPLEVDLRTLVSDIETPLALLTFQVHTPVNGTVQLIAGHIARFMPNQDYFGPASFGYTVTDTGDPAGDTENPNFSAPLSRSNTVSITVISVNDPPIAPPQLIEQGVLEDVPTLLAFTGLVGGPPNEPQGVTLSFPTGTTGTTTQGGTVVIVSGQVQYTSAPDWNSERFGVNDTFTLVVTDSGGLSTTTTVSVFVTAVPDPPTANDDGADLSIEVPDGGITQMPLSVILANDSNEPDAPGNDNLTVAIGNTDNLPEGVSVSVDNVNGLLIFDTENYEVPLDGEEIVTFTYTITNVAGLSSSATVTIVLVPNTLPRAVNDTYSFLETELEAQPVRLLDVIDGPTRPDRALIDFDNLVIVGISLIEETSTAQSVTNAAGIIFTVVNNQLQIDTSVDPDLFGTFTVFYTLNEVDDQGEFLEDAVPDVGRVTIIIVNVNDAPTFAFDDAVVPDAILTVLEDNDGQGAVVAQVVDPTTIDPGPNEQAQQTTFQVQASDPSFFKPGTLQISSTGELRFELADNVNGTVQLTITVQDDGGIANGGIDTFTRQLTLVVTPVNDPPVVTPGQLSVNENTAGAPTSVQIDLRTLVTDVETADDDLVFNVDINSAANGTVVWDGQFLVTYTPDLNYNGTDSFTFTVTDTGENPDLADEITVPGVVNVAINAVNTAPVVTTGQLNVNENTAGAPTSVQIDLRTLVTDIETADDDLVFVVNAGSAANGTVVFDGAFTVTYTPNVNFNGADSFTFTVTDTGDGDDDPITVPGLVNITIAAVNTPPVVDATPVSLNENTAGAPTSVQIDLRTLVTDVETADNDLVFNVNTGSAAHGTVVWNGAFLVTYTPNVNYNGADSFTFTVTDTGDGDGTGLGAPIMVNGTVNLIINAVNTAPIAQPANFDMFEDGSPTPGGTPTPLTVDLRTLVTDVETADDDLVFSVGGAVNGTVQLVNGHNAVFMPNPDYFGPASFTYSVTDTGDGNGTGLGAPISVGPVTIAVNVLPVNDPPRPVDDAFTTFKSNNSGPTTLYNVLANDIANQPFGEQNETLTLVGAEIVLATPPVNGGPQPTVEVDAVTNQLRFLPNGYAGVVQVRYTVSDGQLTADGNATFTVRDFEPGVISGYVFADVDLDTHMDGSVNGSRPERRYADVEVWLVGKVSAIVDPSQPTIAVMTRTDITGRFVFSGDTPGLEQGLPPGSYVVQLDNPHTAAIEGLELHVDSPDSVKSLTVNGTNSLPSDTSATVLGGNKIRVTFGELGVNAELNIAVRGLMPQFVSIRDHLNTTSPYGVVFGVNLADQTPNHQYWYSVYEDVDANGNLLSNPGWYGFRSLRIQVAADLSTAVVTAIDAVGTVHTLNLSFTTHFNKIRVMGKDGNNATIRLEGVWSDFFPSAQVVPPQSPDSASGEGWWYASGEGDDYAASADEIFGDESWA